MFRALLCYELNRPPPLPTVHYQEFDQREKNKYKETTPAAVTEQEKQGKTHAHQQDNITLKHAKTTRWKTNKAAAHGGAVCFYSSTF